MFSFCGGGLVHYAVDGGGVIAGKVLSVAPSRTPGQQTGKCVWKARGYNKCVCYPDRWCCSPIGNGWMRQ